VEFCFTCWEFPFRSSFFWPSCGIRSSRSSPRSRYCAARLILRRVCHVATNIDSLLRLCESSNRRKVTLDGDRVAATNLIGTDACRRSKTGRVRSCIGLFDAERETASGQHTSVNDRTAAHRSLPFGTLIRVGNQDNGHSAIVRITDRGPHVSGRIIDVSQIAAHDLGFADDEGVPEDPVDSGRSTSR
jgi:rare lipoprotein A (peptidoglycan hydrolase)